MGTSPPARQTSTCCQECGKDPAAPGAVWASSLVNKGLAQATPKGTPIPTGMLLAFLQADGHDLVRVRIREAASILIYTMG